jgi:hypothetical protein
MPIYGKKNEYGETAPILHSRKSLAMVLGLFFRKYRYFPSCNLTSSMIGLVPSIDRF